LVNKNLNFAKAHHIVLSYDARIAKNMHLKVEPYFQYLFDVPGTPTGAFSIINIDDHYMNNQLKNNGIARNYGVELTLERYMESGYYYMLTGSLFDSKYKAADGKWRNTAYNRKIVVNALGGKEWMLGKNKQNVLGVSARVSLLGGRYYTPIDMEASLAAQHPIDDESRVMDARMPMGVQVHFSVSFKINKQKVAHEFALKMLNVTAYDDYYYYDYNYNTGKIDDNSAAISIPNVYYRISF
jgi:hypothetical protein